VAYDSSDNEDIGGNLKMHIIDYFGRLRTILKYLLDVAEIVESRKIT
jgi:hypothetical protein